jgi:hypothetical protein
LESDLESDLDLELDIILGDLVSNTDSKTISEAFSSEDLDNLLDQIILKDLFFDQFYIQIPSLKKVPASGSQYNNSTRVQCLALIAEKAYYIRIRERTSISQSAQNKLRKKALERG